MGERSFRSDSHLSRRTVLGMMSGTALGVVGGLSAVGEVAGADGRYTEEEYNGRFYTRYVPSTYDPEQETPLVMLLHGCSQGADGIKNATGMNQVAEENSFIVVYPQQTAGIFDCWQWFNDANTSRGNGELAELVGIVNQAKDRVNIDDQRVYIAGFSAGGAFAPNAIVEYADVFAAVGIHSGTMYDVAESRTEGNLVINSCDGWVETDPVEEGTHAAERMEQFGIARSVPTIVFHGTADYTVDPCNGHQATTQATVTNDQVLAGSVEATPDETHTGSGSNLSYTVYEYHDPQGRPIVEKYIVDGMGHAWSGGAAGSSYTAPGGPSASRIIWEFFNQWSLSATA